MCLKYSKLFIALLLICVYFHAGTASILFTTTASNSVNSCKDDMFCPDGYKCDFEVNKCIPYCSFDCGLGSCIGPEECKCDPGYYSEALMEDSEPPRCKPVCEFCEGTCIRPYTCVCKPEFEAVNVSPDGGDCDCFGNCTGRICESTKCVQRSTIKTTTKELSSSSKAVTLSELYDDGTETNLLVTFGTTTPDEDYSYELFSTSADLNQYYLNLFHEPEIQNELQEAKVSGSNSWIYYAAGSVILIIAVTVLIIRRHAVFSCFRRNSYSLVEIEEKLGPQIHAMDMDFLTIE